jgi:hypothetical protein
VIHDVRRDCFRVFDGQVLPIEYEWAKGCLLGHYDRVQWVDYLTRSGQRNGSHSLPISPNHTLKTVTGMDHSHHHMSMDHSATPDTSASEMDRCVMYMLWFVNLSHCTSKFCVITRPEVRAGTRISSIHVSYSANGTSTPAFNSSLAASQSSSSA